MIEMLGELAEDFGEDIDDIIEMFENSFPYKYDKIHIGSTGFAQVGQLDYYTKQQIEGGVLLEHIRKTHPIPKEFSSIANIAWGSNRHEMGTYHELEVKYERDIVEDWEVEGDPLFDAFWDWINTLNCIDFENPELIEKMEDLYQTQKEIEKEVERSKKREHVRA